MTVSRGSSTEITRKHLSSCITSSTTAARSAKRGAPRRTVPTSSSTAEIAGKVAIAATELANNLLTPRRRRRAVDPDAGRRQSATLSSCWRIDRGPGMGDIERCLTDGYSTAGTPGTGLGAVRRLPTEFDIYSAPGEGTIVMARFGPRTGTALRRGERRRSTGEIECGDAWRLVSRTREAHAVIVVDGLGHGTFAAEAAQAAASMRSRHRPGCRPRKSWMRADVAMSQDARWRGGLRAHGRRQTVSYAGVGQHLRHAGVASASRRDWCRTTERSASQAPRVQQFEYQRTPGTLLIMHSDGVSARWDLKGSPGVVRASSGHHCRCAVPRLTAANRDDATVVVVG